MKILIADDHELFLKGLEFILQSEYPDAGIVLAKDYMEIFEQLKKFTDFDLIISDLAMPGANWLEALQHIHGLAKDVPIVIISAVFDKEIVRKTIEVGVSGYIPKSSSNAVMLSAINLVKAGGVYIPYELLNDETDNKEIAGEFRKLKVMTEANYSAEAKKRLTPRQVDVVRAIARGLSNKMIAYELGLTEGTVKVHVTVILKVLGVTNRVAAVMEAVKQGYITSDDVNL